MMTRFAPVTKRHAVQLRVGRAYGIDVLGDYFKVMNLHGRPRSGSRVVDLVILHGYSLFATSVLDPGWLPARQQSLDRWRRVPEFR